MLNTCFQGRINLVEAAKKFQFMRYSRVYFAISGAIILLGVVSLLVNAVSYGGALNYGIDFTGGLLLDLRFERPVTTTELRGVLTEFGLGGSSMVTVERDNPKAAIIRTKTLSDSDRQKLMDAFSKKISPIVSEDAHLVSGTIAADLRRLALISLGLAIIGMLAYITYRFEFKFGVAAVLALVHDALVTVGIFSLFRVEVNTPFVAAMLTILGYSINDTIVVFDRIRENLKLMKKENIDKVVDTSISQTLARSINTSLTTLLAVAAIYLLGGRTLKEFSLALLIGITAGTYSSIFIASPIWVAWKQRELRSPKSAAKAKKPSSGKTSRT